MAKRRSTFQTIHTEGGLLPADHLVRIAEGEEKGLAPADYDLPPRETINEAVSQSWARLCHHWEDFQEARQSLPDDDPGTEITNQKWLLPLFRELGFGKLTTSKSPEIDGKAYPIRRFRDHLPIHFVGCNVHLDKRSPGVKGAATGTPHGMVQEFLNRSDDSLWAFVSNGRRLRVLRDNAALSRQAYVEFDLEAMFDGEVYPDFVILWTLCHVTRTEGTPETCWLETWSLSAREHGTRVLEDLRIGVEKAIAALGRGFVSHPANDTLRRRLRGEDEPLDKQDLYRQVLRTVYRLLFLFVAEDRDLIHADAATDAQRDLYEQYYSTHRLRDLAGQIKGSRHGDLWHALSAIFAAVSGQPAAQHARDALGLPALGGSLWNLDMTPDVRGPGPEVDEPVQLANEDLLEAVRHLAYVEKHRTLRRVDYKELGFEELGSVYESLLELQPEINPAARHFELRTVTGSERKTTGSYYTPESLVQCLLDSALDPVLDDRLKSARKPEDKEQALLDLKVCDPACGSGHFLIAAAHRIARRLSEVRARAAGEAEPTPDIYRRALRDVIRRCVFGVDINPMALELCKVAFWIESMEPGKPLAFLDHHLQCGNALLGATPALLAQGIPDDAFKPIEGDDKDVCRQLKKTNRAQRKDHEKKQGRFAFRRGDAIRLGNMPTTLARIADEDEDLLEDVEAHRRQWEQAVHGAAYENARFLADAWCAAFVWPKDTSEIGEFAVTEQDFRDIEDNPAHFPEGHTIRDQTRRLTREYKFLHWHLAFPEVFRVPADGEEPDNPQAGWSGGFDCVVGNPPWENIRADPSEFFAAVRPDIAQSPNANSRSELIERLASEDPELAGRWKHHLRFIGGQQSIVNSKRFPLGSKGKTNTMPLFLELFTQLLRLQGRAGIIVKSVIGTDREYQPLFTHLLTSHQLISFYDFINEASLFPAVHRQERFALLTIGSTGIAETGLYAFHLTTPSDTSNPDRRYRFTVSDVRAMANGACRLPTIVDPCLVRILIAAGRTAGGTSYLGSDFNLDSYIMYDGGKVGAVNGACGAEEVRLDASRSPLSGTNQDGTRVLAVYESKMFGLLDHRLRTFEGIAPDRRYGKTPSTQLLSAKDKQDPAKTIEPRWWVPATEIRDRLVSKGWDRRWLLLYGRKGNRDNQRTFSVSFVPLAGSVDVSPLLLPKEPQRGIESLIAAAAVGQSFIFDFLIRSRLIGFTVGKNLLQEIPVPALETFNAMCPWSNRMTLCDWVLAQVLELSYTAWDLEAFGQDCSYCGPPFIWDESRRFLLQCELDAAFFHVYAIDSEDVTYIMSTFGVLQKRDEAAHGTYRTKDTILEIYDAMAEAVRTGEPYRTRLDPPPGPPMDEEGNFLPLPEWKPGQPRPADWPPHIHPPRDVSGRE